MPTEEHHISCAIDMKNPAALSLKSKSRNLELNLETARRIYLAALKSGDRSKVNEGVEYAGRLNR